MAERPQLLPRPSFVLEAVVAVLGTVVAVAAMFLLPRHKSTALQKITLVFALICLYYGTMEYGTVCERCYKIIHSMQVEVPYPLLSVNINIKLEKVYLRVRTELTFLLMWQIWLLFPKSLVPHKRISNKYLRWKE